ncbi:uncharacterized protein FIBRA_04615 [Fibroporia radiculosa]|uniref:Uncharacterized protein n=1 Tax=Fibroporia radiculosa TaxID=599839 RepID=J4G7N4_9APHY|nr:uncharacterized protein FIBRA_04615 [Fibroporia radiculosa]CCM02513.1 predicted protein [Fibroporia radiculosa]
MPDEHITVLHYVCTRLLTLLPQYPTRAALEVNIVTRAHHRELAPKCEMGLEELDLFVGGNELLQLGCITAYTLNEVAMASKERINIVNFGEKDTRGFAVLYVYYFNAR